MTDEKDLSKDSNSEVGDSDNAKSDNSGTKDSKMDLEEMTYKERFGNSTREFQTYKETRDQEAKTIRELFGLKEDEAIDPEKLKAKIIQDKKDEDSEKKDDDDVDDDSDSKDDDDSADSDKDSEDNKDTEDKKSTDNSSNVDIIDLVDDSERTAMDLVWERVAEKYPELNSDAELRKQISREFNLFRKDSAGNKLPLRESLERTIKFVNYDREVEKAKKKGFEEGILKATGNKAGEIAPKTSKTQVTKTIVLSDEEKNVAKKMRMSEEDYAKWKNKD